MHADRAEALRTQVRQAEPIAQNVEFGNKCARPACPGKSQWLRTICNTPPIRQDLLVRSCRRRRIAGPRRNHSASFRSSFLPRRPKTGRRSIPTRTRRPFLPVRAAAGAFPAIVLRQRASSTSSSASSLASATVRTSRLQRILCECAVSFVVCSEYVILIFQLAFSQRGPYYYGRGLRAFGSVGI